ncbi:ethanolamine ammonia-lyase subunit EutC [Jiella mangrovi]|uniref:Ethanolamine ammonia-lyase small subunit n=1 Tax=Jiella mangrovi TaxID=2821407 RepID=A0ABS4BM14_9HYPH|nr:ethanolamine ammonia-lyase subunit EutC [Jiella mangrovi]MBP0617224.1 ethanolamine ammonia-lyase subunit EutC [Jiella mangrovi]
MSSDETPATAIATTEQSEHPLKRLRDFTEARIGLGRRGAGLPTAAHLDFAEDHAKARDAVHSDFAAEAIASALEEAGYDTLPVKSQAGDRATYLRRPDLGRLVADNSRDALTAAEGGPFDLVLILADGLSATAVNAHGATVAVGVLKALPQDWRIAPVVIAAGARVALSDPIGEAVRAKIALMLVGERPGLSAANSLGAYLTFDPKPGRSDADRNCVSNIRPAGLDPQKAGEKLAALVMRSAELQLSGTGLKDDADDRLTADGDDTPRIGS